MLRTAIVVLLAVLMIAGPAAADGGGAILSGKVTDLLGKPIPNARVHVLGGSEHKTARTDANGNYAVELDGNADYSIVIAAGTLHTFRSGAIKPGQRVTVDIEVETADGEIIRIIDQKPATVPPKVQQDRRRTLPYSEEAVERDAWAKAWLLLDVDEKGKVKRVKLLKRPGFDLDDIAVKEAMKLTFDPALDEHGKPMRTLIVWSFEWPSHGWLATHGGITSRMPVESYAVDPFKIDLDIAGGAPSTRFVKDPLAGPEGQANVPNDTANDRNGISNLPHALREPATLSHVTCAGTGPLNLDKAHPVYRDCSRPDMRRAKALPWLDGTTPVPPVDPIVEPDSVVIVRPPPRGLRARIPEIAATTALTGLAVGFGYSYWKMSSYKRLFSEDQFDVQESMRERANYEKWLVRTFALGLTTMAATAVTLFVWTRHQTGSFSIAPNGYGASAQYQTSF